MFSSIVACMLLCLTAEGQDRPAGSTAASPKLRFDAQPFPSLLAFGSVDGNHLLVNQIVGSQRGPGVQSPYVWNGGDSQWYWIDLARPDIASLQAVFPDTAEGLRRTGNGRYLGAPASWLHRWRLGRGQLWATRAEAVLGPLPWESGAILLRLVFPVTKATVLGERRMAIVSHMRFVQGEAGRGINVWPPNSYRLDFDIVPLTSQRVMLFLLVNKEIGVWEYSFAKAPANAGGIDWPWKGEWRQRGAKFAAPFGEQFHVAAGDGAYFFVTDSGAVYSAKEGKDKWTTKEVWKDKRRPIVAMLVESDGATAYVFGKDFYFKLAKKIDVKPCRDVAQPEAKVVIKGLDALKPNARIAYECARVLYEKGALETAAAKK